jgi:hypothetical protein
MLGLVQIFIQQAAPFNTFHTHPGGRRMRISRLHFSIVVLVALALLASCGGSSSALFGNQDTSQGAFMGIQNGDFKAVRYNETGYRDSALNPTLDLQTSASGDTTTVTVAIDDSNPMYGVAMDLLYDTSKYTPVDVTFSGLVADPVELSVTKADYVALGQASLDGQSKRSGQFAVVTFKNEACKTVSADGDPYNALINRTYNAPQLIVANQFSGFHLNKATAEDGSPATADIYGLFAMGDGDQNGEANISDLTPMVSYGWFLESVSDTNFAPAIVDYDANGEVSVADLSMLGDHFGESCTGIEILLGDDATFADTDVAVDTISWAESNFTDPASGVVSTNWPTIYRHWAVEGDLAALQAADTNADGTVYVSARSVNATGVGPAFPGMALTYVSIDNRFIINNFAAEIVGDATTPVVDGATLGVLANEGLTLNVAGISGTFSGVPFTPADRGTVVPAADYDTTLASVAALVHWQAGLDAGMIATTAGVANPASVTGTGQTVAIFPDDDPDYGAGNPEGTLVVTLPVSGTQIPAAISFNMDVNVGVDGRVPVFSAITTDQGQVAGGDNWYLSSTGQTVVQGTFQFGSIAVAEADYVDIKVQLVNLDGGASLDFTVIPSTGTQTVGTAMIRETMTPGTFAVSALVGLDVIPGATYGLRISVPDGTDAWWTSINKPGAFLEVAPPPTPVVFKTMPPAAGVGPATDDLWIYYPDPRMRRNPAVNVAGSDITPVDNTAYLDTIKNNGAEFSLTALGDPHSVTPVQYFPSVIMIPGANADTITSTTTGEAGVTVAVRTPNYIIVDIAAITPLGAATSEQYAFKVFGAAAEQANWPNLGTGTFTVAMMDIFDNVIGADFGINIFDGSGRGDLLLADRDYTGKILNASNVLTAAPDLLYVELSGGRSDSMTDTDNVQLIIENANTSARMTVPLSIRAVGIGTDALYRIGIHNFVAEDFTNAGQPGWPGVLNPGVNFHLLLDAGTQPGSDDFDFGDTDVLTVVGVNPNS